MKQARQVGGGEYPQRRHTSAPLAVSNGASRQAAVSLRHEATQEITYHARTMLRSELTKAGDNSYEHEIE